MKILTYKDYLDKKYYLSNLNKECMKILEDKCENGNCKLGMIEEDKEIYCCEQSGRLYIGRAYLEISWFYEKISKMNKKIWDSEKMNENEV